MGTVYLITDNILHISAHAPENEYTSSTTLQPSHFTPSTFYSGVTSNSGIQDNKPEKPDMVETIKPKATFSKGWYIFKL